MFGCLILDSSIVPRQVKRSQLKKVQGMCAAVILNGRGLPVCTEITQTGFTQVKTARILAASVRISRRAREHTGAKCLEMAMFELEGRILKFVEIGRRKCIARISPLKENTKDNSWCYAQDSLISSQNPRRASTVLLLTHLLIQMSFGSEIGRSGIPTQSSSTNKNERWDWISYFSSNCAPG